MRAGGGRSKGASGERELAALLTGWAEEVGVELDLSRNLEQTRAGGHDLVGLEEFSLAVEVKRVESNSVASWWKQAVRQGERVGMCPVLAHRRNRQPWRFRIRAWVYPATEALDVDLEAEEFKKWFLARILLVRGGDPG